jgi:DNA (cytosine-5)-methyltransferase 1
MSEPLRLLDLFSGIGGFSLGLERTGGFKTVAFCEIDPFCRRVLAKHWPETPCYDDVSTFRGDQLGPIDVICGGFPCQDISYAGPGEGLAGARSGLWREYARLIGELGPQLVIVENVAARLTRGMGEVLGTLSDLGYDAIWDTPTACGVGHPHVRRRVFLVAYSDRFDGRERLRDSLTRAFRSVQTIDGLASARARSRARLEDPSGLYGGADGLPNGMERNHAIGNAVVPDIAELIGSAIVDALSSERAAA